MFIRTNQNIIWTRSSEHKNGDLQLFSKYNNPEIIFIPCISYKKTNYIYKTAKKYNLIVFTSKKSVALALEDKILTQSIFMSNVCISHGSETIKYLEKHNIKAKHVDVQSASELTNYIIDNYNSSALILIISVKNPKINIDQELAAQFNNIEIVKNYETIIKAEQIEQNNIEQIKNSIVCFASPSAVTGFVNSEYFKYFNQENMAISIGHSTAKLCSKFFKYNVISENQTCSSLLETALKQIKSKLE